MIRFAEIKIDEIRRFAFYDDGDGVIVNAGFLRFDEAEHWATWKQFVADYETTRLFLGDLGNLTDYRLLCPDWVV